MIFDIKDTDIRIIDRDAETILSNIAHLVFNDHRLCCLWKDNAHCRYLTNLSSLCPTLLPHRSIGYIVFTIGSFLIVINIIALFANRLLTRTAKLSKLTSLMTCVDIVLASYLPFIGGADMHYSRFFVIYAIEWRQWIFCRCMEVLTATATMTSLIVNCLFIGLTKTGVISITFDVSERWPKIIGVLSSSFLITIITHISFVLAKVSQNISDSSAVNICNVMGNPQPKHWTDVLSIWALCILMVVGFLFVSCSAFSVLNHIVRTGKGVKNISDNRRNNTQNRMSVYNYMIILVTIKSLVTMPYPLLRMVSFLYHLPEDIYLYAILVYIISESLSTPSLSVIRPLLIAQRMK